MATSIEYIQFVVDEINSALNGGALADKTPTFKKMFGEYMIYLDKKPILLVCDDTVFIKKYGSLKEIMVDADVGFPYGGAKEHYVLDIENKELTEKVLSAVMKAEFQA